MTLSVLLLLHKNFERVYILLKASFMKISVCIIVYKTKYLEHSFKSLINQTHKDVEFLILDQEDGVWSASEFFGAEI